MRADTTTKGGSTRPELVIGVSGLALLGLSFVPWWGSVTTSPLRLGSSGLLPSATGRFNAFFGYGWTLELAIFAGVVASGLALGRGFSKARLPRWLYFSMGSAMTLLVLASAIRGPVDSDYQGVAGIEVARGPLVVVALVPCVLIALAGVGFARSRTRRRR